jgi:hypothetical protein
MLIVVYNTRHKSERNNVLVYCMGLVVFKRRFACIVNDMAVCMYLSHNLRNVSNSKSKSPNVFILFSYVRDTVEEKMTQKFVDLQYQGHPPGKVPKCR